MHYSLFRTLGKRPSVHVVSYRRRNSQMAGIGFGITKYTFKGDTL